VNKLSNKPERLGPERSQPFWLALKKTDLRNSRNEGFGTYFFLIPSSVIVLSVLLYPVFRTLYTSFTNSEGLSKVSFIGLQNYLNLFRDPILLRTLTNVGIWTLGTLLLPVALGLVLAYLSVGLKGSAVYRMIFLLPYILSGVAVASIWLHIFRTEGLINSFLKLVGLGSWAQSWLLTYPQNTISMIIVATWGGTGLIVVLFTVGLQNIPLQTVEAATIDGAGAWMMFRHIIWPQLKFIRAVVIGTALANSLRTFDIVWVMTQGGPARISETLAVTMYRESFLLNRYGYGSAIAVLLMVLVVGVSFFSLRGGLKRDSSI
jgi:multiple sugar transport system permease protein